MKPLAEFLNAVSVLVPDFLWLSPIAAAFFRPFEVARACGLIPGTDPKPGLEVALALAYVTAFVLNPASRSLLPARPRRGMSAKVAARGWHDTSGVSRSRFHANSVDSRVLVTRP